MSEPLIFKGTVHPPAKSNRDHPSDLSAGELLATTGALLSGLPLHVEHDTRLPSVGNVLASYEGPRRELRVIAKVDDPDIAAKIRSGELRGLSLGTDCVKGMDGQVLSRSQRELSVCEEGRRNGTWVTHLDNQVVHQLACFSAKGACRTFCTPAIRISEPLHTNK